MALRRCYGMAAAWLRGGACPPDPLGAWLSGRLDLIAEACAPVESAGQGGLIVPSRKPDIVAADVAVAVGARRRGRAGRKPGRSGDLQRRTIVNDVQQFIDWGAPDPTTAMRSVMAMYERLRLPPVSIKKIEAAWGGRERQPK